MKITRNEAKKMLAFIDLIHLNKEDREMILIDYHSNNDDFEDIEDCESYSYNKDILDYLTQQYKGIINKYFEEKLFQYLNKKLLVIGEIEPLIECRCCSYKTIEKRGNYDICKVCNWEDDGLNEIDKYSGVNRSTLREAKINFIKSGVTSKKYLRMTIVNDSIDNL